MNAPVRVVCRGCLRSIELEADGFQLASGTCPYCGQALDSRTGPTPETVDSESSVADSSPSRGGATQWTATWSRGSLGVLGRFQLRDRLGDGGFGEVFLAYDPRLDRDVALKVLRQAHPNDRVLERFFREARAAARLDHPNIVAVYDSGFDRGRCWVAYQRVVGKPLWWHLDHHPIEPAVTARLIRDLAEAIGYAHDHGVVHRDIKPANILIDALGRPRLIDFGLARRADLDSDLTHDGAIVGTPIYMSPEQAQGNSRQADERSDVFSLGIVLYEALAGRGPNSITTVRSPAHSPVGPSAPSAEDWAGVDPSIPAELIRICKRATSERPEDRYPNARAFAADLDAWIRTSSAPPAPARRRPSLIVACAMAAMMGVASLLGYLAATHSSVAISKPAAANGSLPSESEAAPSTPSTAGSPRKSDDTRGGVPKPIGFVANMDSKYLHRSNCPHAGKATGPDWIKVDSVNAPEAVALKACRTCWPRGKAGADRSPADP